ncbi:alpha/beta hydrolase [Hymenobacter sp. BT186]|uniref:Alpha/beta hydrolase n=1 Tax=Hymenobacter telluris TaxID=2816474 RepID=A0A939F0V4_9BACT|nr:alpha/beta hydrolase [Hymenobacter telluris]MBO0360784.1 alpha/beta hydrolase [Hymenobacter telluris]MBW3376812.1 alpha/beta hydrolase [Hymenobacter norwichensis]
MHSLRPISLLPAWFLPGYLLLVGIQPVSAQVLAPPDTSFTVHSAFTKAKKNYPAISIARPAVPTTIRTQTNITYCTIGNRSLQLDVFQPKARRKQGYPAVLFVFGGGWRSGDRSHHMPIAQQVAAQGYVTVTADYRLSTEALYPAAVHDLKGAIRWLRANAKTYNLDTTKIAVWGFSAGGQLASLVGTTSHDPTLEGASCHTSHSSSVQAIVDVDGTLAFIHPESGEGNDSKGPSAATYWFGASKTEKPELWHQAGALNHVTSQTPPIMFINSAVDRMHAGREDMIKQLDAFHIYHETHTFPDSPHTFPLFNPWFEPTLNYTVKFLNKVFKSQ